MDIRHERSRATFAGDHSCADGVFSGRKTRGSSPGTGANSFRARSVTSAHDQLEVAVNSDHLAVALADCRSAFRGWPRTSSRWFNRLNHISFGFAGVDVAPGAIRSSSCRYAFLGSPRDSGMSWAKQPGHGCERLCRRELCLAVRGTGGPAHLRAPPLLEQPNAARVGRALGFTTCFAATRPGVPVASRGMHTGKTTPSAHG